MWSFDSGFDVAQRYESVVCFFGEITEYAGLVYGRLGTVFFERESLKPIVVSIDREGFWNVGGVYVSLGSRVRGND